MKVASIYIMVFNILGTVKPATCQIVNGRRPVLFNLFYNCLKGIGMVHRKVCQTLSVDGNSVFVNLSHELGITHSMFPGGRVDPLYPQRAEI